MRKFRTVIRNVNLFRWWVLTTGLQMRIAEYPIASQDHVLHHDGVIKWKHFPCYWPFVRGIHRSPVNSPHKGQRRGALMFSLICVWIIGCENNREAGDLRRHRTHHDVIVMIGADWWFSVARETILWNRVTSIIYVSHVYNNESIKCSQYQFCKTKQHHTMYLEWGCKANSMWQCYSRHWIYCFS